MMTNPQVRQEEEPIGIVITRGARPTEIPRFSAYVWGPAPAETVEARAAQAA